MSGPPPGKGVAQRETAGAVMFLAASALICTMPLFARGGLPGAHDTVFHAFQSSEFSRTFEEGVLYPRWVAGANNGYGSPTFIFYAPLSYFFVAVVNLAVKSVIRSMILAIWAGFFLSGLSMFVAARKMSGGRGALPAALLYQLAPFHVLDIYLRGTFAEFFAFIWFPLIFLFLCESMAGGRRGPLTGLALSYSGLILTHLVSGFIFGVIALLCVSYSFLRMTDRRRPVMAAFSLLAGLGLSAFYLLPAIHERQFVQIEYLTTCAVCDYRENFLFTADKFRTILGGFFFVLNLLVILETALFVFAVSLLKGRRDKTGTFAFLAIAFTASLFLVLPVSRPVWDIAPGFAILQFPWRWITVMEPALCLIAALAFEGMERTDSGRGGARGRMAVYAVALSLVSLAIIYSVRILPGRFLGGIIEPRSIGLHLDPTLEYAPRWANPRKMSGETGGEVQVLWGAGNASVAQWKSELRQVDVAAYSPVTLRIATFFYPGWRAAVDGRTAEIGIENGSGAMLLNVPEGRHAVELTFRDTPLRRGAKMVSAAFLLFIAAFVIYRGKKTAGA